MLKENVDVLIIGAGPSGCVSAGYLHKNNVSIKVVEKSKFPRFVIGESLIPRSMEHYEEAGLLDSLMVKDFEKKFGARFIRGEEVCLLTFQINLPKAGIGLGKFRADFDNTLAQEIIQKELILNLRPKF